MARERTLVDRWAIASAAVCWLVSTGSLRAELGESPPPAQLPRVFASSRYSIDEILTRPFDRDVPMGCTGARIWASSPQGWAFSEDVHWIDLTDLKAFDIEVRDESGFLAPAKATYYPSHVHYDGAVRKEMAASASFTFAGDRVENPLEPPFRPEKRWTCWSSGKRQDWYEVCFGAPRQLTGFDLAFFDDAPGGECRPPKSFQVLIPDEDARGWRPLELRQTLPERSKPGEIRVRFRKPAGSRRFRFLFHHAGSSFYTGLYRLVPIDEAPASAQVPIRLELTCDKFITSSDTLVTNLRVHNPTAEIQTIYVDPEVDSERDCAWSDVMTDSGLVAVNRNEHRGREPRSLWIDARRELRGVPIVVRFRYAVVDDPPRTLKVGASHEARDVAFPGFTRPLLDQDLADYKLFGHHVGPGKTKVFKAALEFRKPAEPSSLDSVVKPATDRRLVIRPGDQDVRDPLAAARAEYQSWFDQNLAYFDCSDPWVRKMYYHRAYVLRKNMLEPKLGRMQWPTQSEGRWRSGWYPNVISYGAAHQVREARWLRDPKYWQGHLRTWVENQKSNGVYPSHVTPQGPSDGQYTDWITSTAWEGQLVAPDDAFLAQVADKLAANVRGWQKEYDRDGDGLLLVDSHWWTGMEYQPSFFYFSDYRVSKDFSQPARQVSLERVDLTAYNYGNAAAVARIYRRLGQPERARDFDDLAAKIAAALLSKMWNPEKRFFFSLRADDDRVADVKEVVGVYPFYFGMVPWGKGYESAWASILDPRQFWTKWPVASASLQCPACSQNGWPGDGRAAGCMWNGPTWPHANSLVMAAMARTLPATRDLEASASPLRREHLWTLFTSFTQAQFRNQDLGQPWTGEFYNGDTGVWKTAERDYNHSTWLDILIPEILGLVPRDDDILEIDPLLPEGALDFFILDGQRYHGHDVSIAWDARRPGAPDHFGDGRKGLDVYVDGKLAVSSPRLGRLRVELNAPRAGDAGSGPAIR